MSFLSSLQGTVLQGYAALQGPQGQPQSAADTLSKLVERLQNSSQHEDKRSSVLGIKGMARDWKADVGRVALPALLDLICQPEIADDVDMAKAVLETLHTLCEIQETGHMGTSPKDCALEHIDIFIKTPAPTHALLQLLGLPNFYIRFFSLQLLSTLLASPAPRPLAIQAHFLTAPGGLGAILSILDDTREIIRNEALLLLLNITEKNADIQKIIAFEGGFDRLFHIIDIEGGIGTGGIVVQDCLLCVGQLLRYNVSNQNYFRETSCIPHLAPMLLFPPIQDPHPAALDAFATQPWTEQKISNALLIIALARTLVSGAGTGKAASQRALLNGGFARCLAEIGLASTAPEIVKCESLHTLASIIRDSEISQEFLSKLVLSPLAVSFVESEQALNQSEQPLLPNVYRLPPQSAIVALISLALTGIPGSSGMHTGNNQVLRLRASGISVLESFLSRNPDAQVGIVATMNTPTPEASESGDQSFHSPGSLLFSALRTLPSLEAGSMTSYTPFFACLIFIHLLRGCESAKQMAREMQIDIDPMVQHNDSSDDDERISLVHLLIGNLMMAKRSQSQVNNAGESLQQSLGWARVMIGYLMVLATWFWDSPATTSEFLSESASLQVLIEPISQASGVDPLVQGLCAFVLGIIYETDRDPASPIPRATLQPILQSRVGSDQFVNMILRLREDPRFKNVGPDVLEWSSLSLLTSGFLDDGSQQNEGLWFDWPFVEFFKNNYASVQRAILTNPASGGGNAALEDSSRQNEVIEKLRTQLAEQSKDARALEQQVESLSLELGNQKRQKEEELQKLLEEIGKLRHELANLKLVHKESEKEQEDLLVLLEEVSGKRKRDKTRMREKGLEVSDDEDDE
ncbi:hypothetical protein O181_013677 [Austropuccinia psidii MF-1]|uniref:General vesicular transport factor p115 n=1 Tax=Austropuccinia psidii MF-1 TaxID=1389203 RepID=A0A9Q3BYT0_9BASI|nr:hypothetical protein [Austropuccinia psidii MF-1]